MNKNGLMIIAAVVLICGGAVFKTKLDLANPSTTNAQNVGINVGDKAPDFTLKDPNGKEIKLSSFKGKLVLIDFWASWCRPCRMENPNLVSTYAQYKDKKFKVAKKGLLFFGVSLDQNETAWKQAIEQDQLTWPHVSDLKGWNSEAAKLYSVRSIPTNFLIDGDGVIIAKNLRGPDLGKQLDALVK